MILVLFESVLWSAGLIGLSAVLVYLLLKLGIF